MDKLAQERGLLNKLREKTNITGKMLESLNPEFQDMMERLRSTDVKIRAHAEQIKDFVRSSKSNLNRRDYLSAATNLSAFHERCRYIAAELNKFIQSVDLKHYKFLLDQFDDEQKEQLFGYDPNKELNIDGDTASVDDVIITASLKKRAGISDWWFSMTDPLADVAYNLTNSRGQAMRALEKRFSISFLKQLKSESATMVMRTQRFLQFLINTFKKLASALATRNVDKYIDVAKLFISKFGGSKGYHDQFVKYYEATIIPLKQQHQRLLDDVKEQKRLEEEKKADQSVLDEEEQQRIWRHQRRQQGLPAVVKGPETGQGLTIDETPQVSRNPEVTNKERQEALNRLKNLQNPPKNNPSISKEEKDQALDRLSDNFPIPLTQKKNHNIFINRIEKIALNNNPKDLALEILKYSEYLENVAPEESLKLLAVAEGIIEDYKSAGIFDFLKKKPEENKEEILSTPPPPPLVTKKEIENPLA
jgi:hypothetical protein